MISLGTVRDTREEGRVELDLGTPVVIELTKKKTNLEENTAQYWGSSRKCS